MFTRDAWEERFNNDEMWPFARLDLRQADTGRALIALETLQLLSETTWHAGACACQSPLRMADGHTPRLHGGLHQKGCETPEGQAEHVDGHLPRKTC